MTQFAFQDAGVEFCSDPATPRVLLADDPGLGKSRQALLAASGRILIVSPAMLRGTWEQEVERWAPDADVTWVSYTSLAERTDNNGVLPRLRPELRVITWDTVIMDECHNVKNGHGRKAAAQARAAMQLRSERLILLTGTPIPNWAHELHSLLVLMFPEDKRFTSFWRWADRWFDVNDVYVTRTKQVKQIGGLRSDETWEDFYRGNSLDTHMLRRSRDDVLTDLPPLTVTDIEVEMTAAQRKVYNGLKRDYIATLPSGKDTLAFNSAARTTKLCKICTGLEIEDLESKGSGKLDALKELLEARKGAGPLVIFAHFRRTVDACATLAESLGFSVGVVRGGVAQSQRDATVDAFQRGEIDVLVGSIATIREGLTLHAADTCIFVERTWTPSRNDQCMRRLHRIGQDRPVTVIRLLTADSIDQRIEKLLEAKTDEQMKALTPAEIAACL